MKAFFYKIAKPIKIIPLNILIQITKQKSIFPFYHLVSDEEVIHIKHLYKVRNVKSFEKDLDFFLKNFYPIDINYFLDKINNGCSINKKFFVLSFDDGLREFHDIIAPILLRKGIPAICFLNSNFIDNKDLFYRYKTSILLEYLTTAKIPESLKNKIENWFINKGLKLDNNYKSLFSINYLNKHYLDELADLLNVNFHEYLQKVKPYLSSNQIQTLIKQGFLFGSHSMDHPQFSDLQLTQQISQIENSIKEITSKFSLNYKLFSFPFTDYGLTKQFFDIVYEKNNQIVDLSFGCAGLKKDSINKNIQRIPIEIDAFSAKEVIYGEYLYYIFKSLFNKNVIRRF